MKAKISGNEEVAKAVLAAEELRLAAMRISDAKALAPLLADNLVYVYSTAIVEDKTGYLMAIDHGTIKYHEDLHIRDVEVRAFAENAIMMGVSESTVDLFGGPRFHVNRFTSLWVKGKDGWQMSTWQSTPVKGSSH